MSSMCGRSSANGVVSAAPFKRNDRMLEILPAGVIVFPGSGTTSNLADKAKKLRIPVLHHREGGA